MRRWVVFSLGGSVLVPGKVDIAFLKVFARFIRSLAQMYHVVVIVGGGSTARQYIDSARTVGVSMDDACDRIGIRATQLNAQLFLEMMSGIAHPQVIGDWKKMPHTSKRVLVGAGTSPGWSTDYVAVCAARALGAGSVINVSNTDFVYSKNPSEKGAVPLRTLSWAQMESLVGKEWKAGLKYPFDPVASRLARRLGLSVACIGSRRLGEAQKFLAGKPFHGSLISDESNQRAV